MIIFGKRLGAQLNGYDGNPLLPDPLKHCASSIDRWRPYAIYPSELAWFLDHLVRSECDTIIECGRFDGVSTEILAQFVLGSGRKVISIDLEIDAEQATQARQRLTGYDVELVAGDVHSEVPRLLGRLAGKSVAVLQDAAKGWEGLATLLAASVADNVGLVAQHNLHRGHVTRSLFQHLSLHPAFIEHSPDRQRYQKLLDDEREFIASRPPHRALDHTSLGVMITDRVQKGVITDSFETLRRLYGPFNPKRVVAAWARGDFMAIRRIALRARFTLARFKPR